MSYPFGNSFYGYRQPSPISASHFHTDIPTVPFPFDHRPSPRASRASPFQPPSEIDLGTKFSPYIACHPTTATHRAQHTHGNSSDYLAIDEEERLLNARLAQLRALRQRQSGSLGTDSPRAHSQAKAAELRAQSQAQARAQEEALRVQRERERAHDARLRARADAMRQYEEEEKAYRAAAAAAAALIEAEAQAEAEAKERAKIAERVARARAYQLQQQQSRPHHDDQASWIAQERERRRREAEMIEAIVRAQRAQEREELEAAEEKAAALAQAQARTEAREQIRQAVAEERSRISCACHPYGSSGVRSPVPPSQRPSQHSEDKPAAAATPDNSKVMTQEELEKKFWKMVYGGAEEERREQEEKTAKEVARPTSPIVQVSPKSTSAQPVAPAAVHQITSASPPINGSKTASATEGRPEVEHLRGVADFLKQAFGVNVTFDCDRARQDTTVEQKPAQAPVVSAATPVRTTSPMKKSTPTPVAPVQKEACKAIGEHPSHFDAHDQLANFFREAFTNAPKPHERKSEPDAERRQQDIPAFLGNLLSAFSDNRHGQDAPDSAKDMKGKGKARESQPDQPVPESSSAGAWAGLSAQEKEESKAIERSYEQAKAIPKVAGVESDPRSQTPKVVAPAPTDVEDADAAKPVETLRSAYNRNANRVARLEQLETLSSRLEKLIGGFTFPETLDFQSPTSSAPSSPSLDPVESAAALEQPQLRVPPLAFSHNNQPYHSQAQGLMQLLTEADAIPSEGDKQVRKARKDFVKMVEAELGRMEVKRGDIWRAQSKADDKEQESMGPEEKQSEALGERSEQSAIPSQDVVGSETSLQASGDAAAGSPELGETSAEMARKGSSSAETDTSAPTSSDTDMTSAQEVTSPKPPTEEKSPNAVTIEDVLDEDEAVSKDRSELPAVSIIEQLPAAAAISAVAMEPEDAGNSSQSFSSSGSESGESDADEHDDKEGGQKQRVEQNEVKKE